VIAKQRAYFLGLFGCRCVSHHRKRWLISIEPR
jgi:hypothetical protein